MKRTYWLLFVILVILGFALVVDLPALARGVGLNTDWRVHKGLDLSGGTHLVYQLDLENVETDRVSDAAQGVADVIDRRINALGVTEPVIQKTRDNGRVIVELPGVTDINEAISLIGETASLSFREGIAGKSLGEDDSITSSEFDDWKDTGLSGAHLVKADVEIDSSGIISRPVVSLEFDGEGTKLFAEATKRNLNKPLAIFLDDIVLSAPTVQSEITEGQAVISGDFDINVAKRLVIQLNAGALPVPINLIAQNNIGASLGADSVNRSIVAGLLGLLLVMLFMILYYRVPGLVAAVALLIYAAISMAIFIYIPVTLTLAGVAGFLLSIGMAVDANILIFERMKEEIRLGKSILASIDAGFYRAWNSIRDSNVATIIITIILYYFGSSLIRGFAVTLGIGTLISMFSAITVTHTLLKLSAARVSDKRRGWFAFLTKK